MPLLPKLIERLQRHPKRVVFPEGAIRASCSGTPMG